MRISVIYNNGRRVKLAPKAAHKVIWHGWAVIAPEDEAGQALYADYLKSEGLDVADCATPADHLPNGYTIERRGAWIALFDPDANQLGKADQAVARLIARAYDHASSASGPSDGSETDHGVLPEGYELETSQGWYHVIGPDGVKIGKGKRTEREAIAQAWEHDAA